MSTIMKELLLYPLINLDLCMYLLKNGDKINKYTLFAIRKQTRTGSEVGRSIRARLSTYLYATSGDLKIKSFAKRQ